MLILSAWFAFGAGLCGGILTHLPAGLAYGTSLYFEVCLSGEILCSVDAGVICLWGLPVW